MTYNNVLIEKEGNIATLFINRPKALNSLNAETVKDIGEAVRELDQDQEVHVIVLTGAGNKAFVAGADIAYMKDFGSVEAREFACLGQEVLSLIENLKKPVIAAINGFALGGGCELAMCCDFRIAATNAKFGQPEINLGIIPGFAGTQRLARIVGKGIAKELIYTGDIIDVNEAYRIGLVNKVVAQEELLSYSKEVAKKIANKGQFAMQMCKQAINDGLEMDSEKAYAYEANLFALCFSTEDQKEGMNAFLEKRKAEFKNK